MGTRINELKLTKVVDGDTIKVEIEGKQESLRLICIDTEESRAGGSKPVTNAGKEASRLAKRYFNCDNQGLPQDDVRVNIEFDTSDPEPSVLNDTGATSDDFSAMFTRMGKIIILKR